MSSCSSQSHKSNFGTTESNVGDFSVDDINNLKESKSCIDGSIGFSRLYTSILGFELIISNYAKLFTNDEYEYFANILVKKSGDISISAAAKLGGIQKIKMVDHSYSITGIMGRRYCVIDYGD
jgi:hypothetical protein